MKILLTTLNTKYIHKNLAIRWLYVTCPKEFSVDIQEYTINDQLKDVCYKMNLTQYDVIGLSVYIWNAEMTKLWIKMIKAINPHIRILLGGPEVSYENDDWFELPIEGIIQGEGEKVFWDYLLKKEPLGIKLTKGVYDFQAKVDIQWLEQYDNPYFLAFDLQDINTRYLYLECSRGCPYHCQYCLSSNDNKVRLFTMDYLFAILAQLPKYCIRQVKFLDRTFNSLNERALILIDYLNHLPTISNFHMELVAETLNEKLLDYMVNELNPNKFRFEIGVQSFNIVTLKAVGRYANVERLKEVINRLNTNNIMMHTDLIAGLPFEDLSSFERSYNELFALDTQEIQVGILKLLKGTKLRQDVDEYAIIAQQKAPYDIISNKWLSQIDLELVSLVYKATEKAYNNFRLRHTIDELTNYYGFSPFQLMIHLGRVLVDLPRPYQNRDLFLNVYLKLQEFVDHDSLKGLLLIDYYQNSKQKPKWLFNEDHKDAVRRMVLKKKIVNAHIFDNYCVVTLATYHGICLYQLVIYNAKQEAAQRYIISINNETIKELR